ncbi:uncharacterized protein LOC114537868 [Dendronephthya gigantea]|uniref:uncharacterized protein LOC114537868 n=1 Tax=Dendronephthya gigantea TaxID=151771 RepID=UPI0010697121|nr:uncharacterized protein LOC114537868 [Dendronephthya gigantea]
MEFAFFDYGNNILRFFCMKNSTTAHSRPWPKGEYCVYKSNNQSCPPGMTPGWVFWDDENESPQTKVGRVSPDGSYVNNTKIFYCCQNDGNYYDSIELPVEEPFYLLTTNSTELPKCQMVKWAFSYLEYLVFDTENDNNSDSQGGDHVFIENNTVYYCYYKDCRHRMTASRDSFYSHKASGSEMERHSQYCSWLITVADQYVISLEFKSLVVLSCNDTFLRIYDGANESAPLYGTYCGSNASKEVKVLSHTNSLYIVSNSGNPERDAKNIATVTFKASYSSENRTEKSTKDKSSQTFTNLEGK